MKTSRLPAITGMLLAFAAQAAEVPADSLYQLHARLTTQDGQASTLDLYLGQPTLVTMFYASCPHVCPTLIAGMQNMERQLPAPAKKRLRVLMVSVDPARDTPEKLKQLAAQHRADPERWTFARMEDDDVRKLAAALGIRYRQLPDGEFNHSTVITLLDKNGRIVHRTSNMSDTDFLKRLSVEASGTDSHRELKR